MHRTPILLGLALLLPLRAAYAQQPRGLEPFASERALKEFFDDRAAKRTPRPPVRRPSPRRGTPPARVAPPPPALAALAGPLWSTCPAGELATLRGSVRGGPHGAPIPRAIVTVPGTPRRTVADSSGRYRIECVPPGVRQVRATRVGHRPRSRVVELTPGEVARVDFQLSEEGVELAPLVATGLAGPERVRSLFTTAVSNVTSVQQQDVDEGGIVKRRGDYLVVLRRGRLFSIRAADHALRPVSAIDAYGPDDDPKEVWYDEMLIQGSRIVVIGYSYARGQTDIGIFRIDGVGRLSHRASYQLRSDDYYSARNYGSRMVDGRLVFYAPLSIRERGGNPLAQLPAVRRRLAGETGPFRRIVSATRVYRPARTLAANQPLTLHTVTTCELRGDDLRCSATGVLGARSRVFYVSRGAAYVWVGDARAPHVRTESGMLMRIPLDGARPSALGLRGAPIDQFSFREGEGRLSVLLRQAGRGDGMWRSEGPADSLHLLQVPLSAFGDGHEEAPRAAYRALPGPGDGVLQNRYVGGSLLYGAGNGWRRPRDTGATLFAVPLRGGATRAVPLSHPVDRIEALGEDALVVGAGKLSLSFTGVTLGSRPHATRHYTLDAAAQGEMRSHGFFYDADSTGILGLPVTQPGSAGYRHLFRESAGILYLGDGHDAFQDLGRILSRPAASASDGCRASCIDWYGNTRPVFVDGRIYALMGYEIVEGRAEWNRVREVRRVSFAPRGERGR